MTWADIFGILVVNLAGVIGLIYGFTSGYNWIRNRNKEELNNEP